MPQSPHTSRVEVEMNLNWADQNPALFVKAFRDFQREYAVEIWTHHIDLSRDQYLTLVAKRRETEGA